MNTPGNRYGHRHRQIRARVQRNIAEGKGECVRCGGVIEPDQPWDLDHTDDGTGYLGPAHVTCNRAAGGRKGSALRRARMRITSRKW